MILFFFSQVDSQARAPLASVSYLQAPTRACQVSNFFPTRACQLLSSFSDEYFKVPSDGGSLTRPPCLFRQVGGEQIYLKSLRRDLSSYQPWYHHTGGILQTQKNETLSWCIIGLIECFMWVKAILKSWDVPPCCGAASSLDNMHHLSDWVELFVHFPDICQELFAEFGAEEQFVWTPHSRGRKIKE